MPFHPKKKRTKAPHKKIEGQHGGYRKGSGRKTVSAKPGKWAITTTVALTIEQYAFGRELSLRLGSKRPNLSVAVRAALDHYRLHPPEPVAAEPPAQNA